jgi:hypothetical protein
MLKKGSPGHITEFLQFSGLLGSLLCVAFINFSCGYFSALQTYFYLKTFTLNALFEYYNMDDLLF